MSLHTSGAPARSSAASRTGRRPARLSHRAVAAVATLPLLALLAACATNADAEPGTADNEKAAEAAGLVIDTSPDQEFIHTTESPEAIALLPEDVKAAGVLKVSTTAGGLPPLGFLADDDKTPIGNEPNIAVLVADALGLDLELEVKAWADWPLALQSGDVDAVISNVTVTEERKELYDFSSYRNDQLGWLSGASNDKVPAIKEAKDIAGLTVGVGSGTNQEKILLAWNEENVAAGLDPVKGGEPEYYEDYKDALLAVASGRLDVYVGPNASLAYSAATAPDQYKVVGTLNGGWPATAQIAVATLKGSELAPAVTAAINHAIEDGSYAKLLEHWGLEDEAIAASETNPPGLPKP
ncbi:MAG: transporter substrate-binding protein [Oerskovia sp.]|jgi:polar amino acid transport system substrate-binding protein|nr:transporter substrate-binding protein [Oerskovia sp.]